MQSSTVDLDLSVLNAVLRKAQVWKKLAEHPGKDVKPFKASSGKTRFLSAEEEATLLTACTPSSRRIVEVGLLAGMRRQELAGLRPEDVDLERGTIRVAESTRKTGESRTLPVGPRLQALMHEVLMNSSVHSERLWNWTPTGITDAFRSTAKRVGLGVMGPHILRHTFASRLVIAGVDLRTVRELMGHKSILMTMRYAHLSPDHKRAAMETLERRQTGHRTPGTRYLYPIDFQTLEEFLLRLTLYTATSMSPRMSEGPLKLSRVTCRAASNLS